MRCGAFPQTPQLFAQAFRFFEASALLNIIARNAYFLFRPLCAYYPEKFWEDQIKDHGSS